MIAQSSMDICLFKIAAIIKTIAAIIKCTIKDDSSFREV